jgi:hypothetical protein
MPKVDWSAVATAVLMAVMTAVGLVVMMGLARAEK